MNTEERNLNRQYFRIVSENLKEYYNILTVFEQKQSEEYENSLSSPCILDFKIEFAELQKKLEEKRKKTDDLKEIFEMINYELQNLNKKLSEKYETDNSCNQKLNETYENLNKVKKLLFEIEQILVC